MGPHRPHRENTQLGWVNAQPCLWPQTAATLFQMGSLQITNRHALTNFVRKRTATYESTRQIEGQTWHLAQHVTLEASLLGPKGRARLMLFHALATYQRTKRSKKWLAQTNG